MPGITVRYPPADENDFERLCLALLRKHWRNPDLQRYGRRGQEQNGVDILDTSGADRPRAAQCKAYDPLTAISPREIAAEVEKAKSFTPRLGEYLIMTTAKNSTEAQQAVIEINRAHRKKHLFKVSLKCWDEIEIMLGQYPTVVDQIYDAGLGSLLTEIQVDLGTKMEVIGAKLDASQTASATAADRDLDEIKAAVEKRDAVIAKWRLQQLRSHSWDSLSNWQRFRLVSNEAAVFFLERDYASAGRLYVEAKRYASENEKAKTNEAFGYFLLGDTKKAFELASLLRREYPLSPRVANIFLNTAPPETDFVEVESQMSASVTADGEVSNAFARRALLAGQVDRAIDRAQRSLDVNPKWLPAMLLLAQAKVRKHIPPALRQELQLLHPSVVERLEELSELLTRIVDLAKTDDEQEILVEALLERARLREMMGNADGAGQDVNEAFRLAPENPGVLRDYADFLRKTGQINRSVEILRRLLQRQFQPDTAYLLANVLQNRALNGDVAEAANLFSQAATDQGLTPIFRAHVISRALACFTAESRWDDAETFLNNISKDHVPELAIRAFRARLLILQGRREEALTMALSLPTQIDEKTDIEDLEAAAALLSELGRYRDALPLWQRVVELGASRGSHRRLIECAYSLQEHKIVLDTCERLRKSGLADNNLLHVELDLLEQYDIEKAIQVLRAQVSSHPADREMQLRLSVIGWRHKRPELVRAALSEMPDVNTVTPEVGKAAVLVMKEAGDQDEALRYAYELLHRHYSHPEAHRAFMLMLHPIGRQAQIPPPDLVTVGTAVKYLENGTSSPRWIVIEDVLPADSRLDEVPPDHQIAKQLLGKRVGDSFSLAPDAISPRIACIQQILSKYVFRYQRCGDEWQIRFPESTDMQVVRVKSEADPEADYDFSAIKASIARKQKNVQSVSTFYREQLIPLHMLTLAAGDSAYDALIYAASQADPFVRCCHGTLAERDAAFSALRSAKSIVLDLTAIATLQITQSAEVLLQCGLPLVISQNTSEVLEEMVDDATGRRGETLGYATLVDGQLAWVKLTDEQRQQNATALSAIVSLVKTNARIDQCPQLAAVKPETREAMVRGFGRYGAEAIILAAEPGNILWSDDLGQASLAAHEFGVSRTWTQQVMQLALALGVVNVDKNRDWTASLLGFGYFFTSVDEAVMVAAAQKSEWKPDQRPFKQAIEYLSLQGIEMVISLRLAAAVIVGLYREVQIPELRNTVLVRTLERLSAKEQGVSGVRAILAALPNLFGVNVIGLADATYGIQAWLAQH